LDVVSHAEVERVPEVASSSRFSTGHAEVVDVSREVGLTLCEIRIKLFE
jgi:hypothetical protein